MQDLTGRGVRSQKYNHSYKNENDDKSLESYVELDQHGVEL